MVKRNKKRELIKRTLVYVIMTTAVGVLVSIVLLAILGYRFNFSTGKVEQGGLVQFTSNPNGARIKVDKVTLSSSTPSKITVYGGEHKVSLFKDGYRDWSTNFSIRSGEIVWLNYARLVPKDLKSEKILSYDSVDSSLFSPNKKWLALIPKASDKFVQLLNVDNETITSTKLNLDEKSYSKTKDGTDHEFKIAYWSGDSRFFLLKHYYTDNDDKRNLEWLRIDRQNDEEQYNLSKLLGLKIDRAFFTDNSSEFYVQNEAIVRRIDIKTRTISRPIAENVDKFETFGDILYFVTKKDASNIRTVSYQRGDMKTQRVLLSDDSGKEMHAEFSYYFSKNYVAISIGNIAKIYQIENLPNSDASNSQVKLKQISEVDLGENIIDIADFAEGRMFFTEGKESTGYYDIEKNIYKTHSFIENNLNVKDTVDWLDGRIYYGLVDSNLYIEDFNGENHQNLADDAIKRTISLVRDGRYIIYFAKDGDKIAVKRINMLVDNGQFRFLSRNQ